MERVEVPAAWRKGWVVEVWRVEGMRARRWVVKESILLVLI